MFRIALPNRMDVVEDVGELVGHDLVAQDELVVEDSSDWMVEDPNVAHEETVDDAFQRSADLELLELDELIDVGGESDGFVGLSLNLNDLLSKAIEFEGNERIVVCFSKKGRPQLAAEGFLYNALGYYHENYECQWRCVNTSCPAKLRSSPGFTELSYLCSTHLSSCIPDDLQLRLRIAVFDLRLVAEFTDHPLEDIHRNFVIDLWNKSPEVAQIFPPFETLARTLQQHRTEKSYRRRFELQHSKAQRLTIDSNILGKKTKPLPLATCFVCGDQSRSSDIPSQDILIAHIQNHHSKPELSIGQFTFADAASFEQWIRAILASAASTPDCRLKKYGVFDECMYYLCANDSRQMLKKRHEAVEELHSSCTAFVRVRDFRNAREKSSTITVDYNLDHWSHSVTMLDEALIPEYFMEHLKAKRKRTQEYLQDTKLQRISRVAAMGATSAVISTRLVNSGEKVTAALARRQMMPNPITAFQFSNQALDQEGRGQTMVQMMPGEEVADKMLYPVSDNNERLTATIARLGPLTQSSLTSEGQLITQRSHFRDNHVLYNHVLQIEQQCQNLVRRMQNCRTVQSAKKHLGKVLQLLGEVSADPAVTIGEARKFPQAGDKRRADFEMDDGGEPSTRHVPILSMLQDDHIKSHLIPPKAKVVKSSTARLAGFELPLNAEPQPLSSMDGMVGVDGEKKDEYVKKYIKRNEQGQLVLVTRRVTTRRVAPKDSSSDQPGPSSQAVETSQ